MSVERILAIPLLTLFVLGCLWYIRILSGTSVLFAGVVSSLAYVLLQAYRYGLVFAAATVEEKDWPGFTCYYKEYECEYAKARKKLHKLMTGADLNMLKSQHQVNYIEIYQDRKAAKETSGHVLAGFALRGEAEIDVGISKVLETLNFRKRKFAPGLAILGEMKRVDEFGGRIAVSKLGSQARTAAEASGKQVGPMFVWEDKRAVSCGVFVGPTSKQYAVKGFVEEPNVKSEVVPDRGTKKTK